MKAMRQAHADGWITAFDTLTLAAISIFVCLSMVQLMAVFFFFQAEDGIRDDLVTGVQTCALPIWPPRPSRPAAGCARASAGRTRARRTRSPPRRPSTG